MGGGWIYRRREREGGVGSAGFRQIASAFLRLRASDALSSHFGLESLGQVAAPLTGRGG